MNTLILQFKKVTPLCLILCALGCFAFASTAQADPAPKTPDPGSVGGLLNTADGTRALSHVTTGAANAAFGWFSLFANTDGSFNTAVGAGTLVFNIGDQSTGEGVNNTAVGGAALLLNTTGSNNTAVGTAAMVNNNSIDNTAVGAFALNANISGNGNTALGYQALFNNGGAGFNTAVGIGALFNVLGSSRNTAIGHDALRNVEGFFNTAIGDEALINLTQGNSNFALGANAGSGVTTANNTICIGEAGFNVDNSCFIGHIRNAVIAPDAAPVLIDSTGKLGTLNGSSRRFKTDIQRMDKSSDSLLALKPVTFHYKSDTKCTAQFGLIAEEVAEVNPDLVVRGESSEINSVRYDAVNAMLLNEFLKEHRTVQEQQKEIDILKAELKEQRLLIEKVSAQLDANKPAPQVAGNNQ